MAGDAAMARGRRQGAGDPLSDDGSAAEPLSRVQAQGRRMHDALRAFAERVLLQGRSEDVRRLFGEVTRDIRRLRREGANEERPPLYVLGPLLWAAVPEYRAYAPWAWRDIGGTAELYQAVVRYMDDVGIRSAEELRQHLGIAGQLQYMDDGHMETVAEMAGITNLMRDEVMRLVDQEWDREDEKGQGDRHRGARPTAG